MLPSPSFCPILSLCFLLVCNLLRKIIIKNDFVLDQNALYFFGVPEMSLNARQTDRTREGRLFSTVGQLFSIWASLFVVSSDCSPLYLQLFIIILLICCLPTATKTKTMRSKATIAPGKISKKKGDAPESSPKKVLPAYLDKTLPNKI